ncbi:MAG TPA: alpha/beta fold hydrolase [Dehalococcoidia bacterium]
MPHAHLNGIDIHYEDRGQGPPVLLTHGYGATGAMWRPQVDALTDRYRLITWDMRGHGGTESPEDPAAYSEALTVEDMRALLLHLGVRRAVVGGLSLGGYMSLAFWLAHPEMVRALVLCDTGPGYRNPAGREQWNQMAERRAVALEEGGVRALGSSTEVTETARLHRSAQGLAHAARGMLKQFDSRVIEALPRIDVPVLILVGERDQPFLAPSDYMERAIPGARKVVVPAAGHAANLDNPEAFNAALLAFLDGLGPAGEG